MANHTTGPWKAAEHSWSDGSVYQEHTKERICTQSIEDECTEDTQRELTLEMRANMQLVAAAPDMLEALQHVLGELDVKGISLAVRYRVEEAIAKAQGEVTT